jgi:beta-lactamase class A
MTAKGILASCVFLALGPLGLGNEPTLADRLAPLAKAHKGTVAIAVKNLATGETFYLNADTPQPTASLIKLPVMIEIYHQATEGKIKLTDKVTLHDSDKVPGSGILTPHLSEGTTFSLRDAVRLMIVFSDNTATNLVLDRIGIPATNKRMEGWGFPNTKIHAKSFRADTTSIDPARSKKYGLGSTTAREMVGLLEKLHSGKAASALATTAMLDHLKNCDDKNKLTRFLPEGTVVAHKTGSVRNARTDAGILYLKGGPVAVCVLTADNEDTRWSPDNAGNLLCARVGQEILAYYAAKANK